MKKRYELQMKHFRGLVWFRSGADKHFKSLRSKLECVNFLEAEETGRMVYRVVQKLGRKVIKVIYPKGK